jgi:hypothetical protein
MNPVKICFMYLDPTLVSSVASEGRSIAFLQRERHCFLTISRDHPQEEIHRQTKEIRLTEIIEEKKLSGKTPQYLRREIASPRQA